MGYGVWIAVSHGLADQWLLRGWDGCGQGHTKRSISNRSTSAGITYAQRATESQDTCRKEVGQCPQTLSGLVTILRRHE